MGTKMASRMMISISTMQNTAMGLCRSRFHTSGQYRVEGR